MKVTVKAFAMFREVLGKKVGVKLSGVRYRYVQALYVKARGSGGFSPTNINRCPTLPVIGENVV